LNNWRDHFKALPLLSKIVKKYFCNQATSSLSERTFRIGGDTQSSDIVHKVKSTIQQAQNNRLSTKLLSSDKINKIHNFVQNSAIFRGLEPPIKIHWISTKLSCPT
jgi:hypothetical protein